MRVKELLEGLDDMPKYPSRDTPGYAGAAAKGGYFSKRDADFESAWMTDEEYIEHAKKAWEIDHQLQKFKDWLEDTCKIAPANVTIYGSFPWANPHQKWEIKVKGVKWKQNDGLLLKMLEKTIPAKWKALLPNFELTHFGLHPKFDPTDSYTKTYTFSAHWEPKDRRENQQFYNKTSFSGTGMSIDDFVTHRLNIYSHNRLSAYIQARHDEMMSKFWADEAAKKKAQ